MMIKRLLTVVLPVAGLFMACNETAVAPKPRAYPRVIYPAKNYVRASTDYCPFSFEHPDYAAMVKDTLFFEEKPASDCWFNLEAPVLNAKIYCSYYPIRSRAAFDKLVADAFEMTNKHNQRATYIQDYRFDRPQARVHGMVFEVEGPVASSYQFFVSDSTSHFLRGALYFETKARPDSLAPVLAFMKQDVDHLLETLVWK